VLTRSLWVKSRHDPRRQLERTGWLLRRLVTMGASEIGARVIRTARHGFDDITWKVAPRIWARGWTPPRPDSALNLHAPRGFLNAERAAGLRKNAPAEVEQLLAKAESTLAGRFCFFGYPEVQLARPIDFAYDPHAHVRWPDRHAKLIDYRHAPEGDPKWLWELNRLQHLPLLVAASLVSADWHYAKHAVEQTLEWAAQSPPGRGIAWSNGYEAALRSISLAVVYDALRGTEMLTSRDIESFRTILWQHARWIERDPSTHSSANNHRIGELVALLTAALLAPEIPGSTIRARKALNQLSAELDRQILADGSSAEQAFYYHLHAIDLALVAVAVLDAVAVATPPRILAALHRSASALALQVGDGEPPPRYGDEDDSRALRLDATETRDVSSVASSLAARLGHADICRLARGLDAGTWWLFGAAGGRQLAETRAAVSPGTAVLPVSGLTILRRRNVRVTVDAGPLGHLAVAAHGHADALAVTVVHAGDELIVDPGTGSYFRRPEVRRAFRGTGFHATVVVDGRDQSEPGGAFLWTTHAHSRQLKLAPDKGLVVAEHDGYCRLRDPVRHRRAVVLLEDARLLIYDRLDAAGSHEYALRFPLHPDLEATIMDSSTVRATHEGGARLLLSLASSHPGTPNLLRGREQPLAGWWSPRLESLVPAWLISYDVHAHGRVDLVSLAVPCSGGAWPDGTLRMEHDGQAVLVKGAGLNARFSLDGEDPEVVIRPSTTPHDPPGA